MRWKIGGVQAVIQNWPTFHCRKENKLLCTIVG